MDEVKRWQQRPLDALYPIVYLDCIVVKSQDGSAVANQSVYLALGVNTQGEKEFLRLWIAKTEGPKFWLSVMMELKIRGLQDIFIVCCDDRNPLLTTSYGAGELIRCPLDHGVKHCIIGKRRWSIPVFTIAKPPCFCS